MSLLWLLAAALAQPASTPKRPPVIDMHFHATPAAAMGPGAAICSPYEGWPVRDTAKAIEAYLGDFTINPTCKVKLTARKTDEELTTANAEILRKHNIIALADGDPKQFAALQAIVPERLIPAVGVTGAIPSPSVEQLRQLHRSGKLKSISEVTVQYNGLSPIDPRMAPYWALAEELDVPIGVHMGPGPPGIAYFGFPKYRMALTDPLQLEEVLLKHPKLRLFVMHAGWPMAERTIALLYAHPQVYVETGIIDHAFPRAEFHRYLKQLVDAGFGKRIMFGSDNMAWPETIDVAVANIEAAPFLSAEQKRDIFYNNAATFLRLSKQEIDRHHGR